MLFPSSDSISNLIIEANSNDTFCSIISLQSYTCPVYDVGEIGPGQGYYQTMTKIASTSVYVREDRKNEKLNLLLCLTSKVNLHIKKNFFSFFWSKQQILIV